MRNLIIKMLGGVTKLEHLEKIEDIKEKCEDFCLERLHLNGNNHSLQGHMSGVETNGNLVVLKSYTSISNSDCKALIVAPWVRKFMAHNIRCI